MSPLGVVEGGMIRPEKNSEKGKDESLPEGGVDAFEILAEIMPLCEAGKALAYDLKEETKAG